MLPRLVQAIIRAAVLATVVLAVASAASAASADGPLGGPGPGPAAGVFPPATRAFGRSDLWYGVGATAAVTLAGGFDRGVDRVSSGPDDPRLHDFARGVRPLGTPAVIGPSVVVGYLTGRLLDRPELSRGSVRTALAVGTASLLCEGIKLSVGRMRPDIAPGEPRRFRPFSSNDAFPSGHTTVAFAFATALDRETDSPWVPALAYPAAAAVGWSRLEDDRHWLSDVVAGAALGWWSANKVESFVRTRGARPTGGPSRVSWIVSPGARHSRFGVRVRF